MMSHSGPVSHYKEAIAIMNKEGIVKVGPKTEISFSLYKDHTLFICSNFTLF